MPLEEVENEKKAKETAKNILKYHLKDIAEVTEETFKKFPNPSEDKDFKLDYKMIMRDFPNLTKEEIKENDSLIARYYAVNLDYEVLQVLKKTKKPKEEIKDVEVNINDLLRPPAEVQDEYLASGGNKDAQERLKRRELKRILERKAAEAAIRALQVKREKEASEYCSKSQNIAECERLRRNIANCSIKRDGNDSNKYHTFSQMNFTSIHSIASGLGVSQAVVSYAIFTAAAYADSEEYGYLDAVRHMYWQGLLCKFYYPIFLFNSKSFRMHFAKKVGEWYEVLGNNYVDDSEMDLHNNAVGRKIWEQLSWYDDWIFFSVLRSPEAYTLLYEARDKYYGRHRYQGEGGVQIVDKILGNYDEDKEPEYKNGYLMKYYPYYRLTKRKKDTLSIIGVSPLTPKEEICYRKHWILNDAIKNRPVQTK